MAPYIGRDLREKIENPLIFQLPGAAAASPVSSQANGYDAAILIDICNAILAAKADGKLSGPRYDKMVEQARLITSASAKNGIRQLVYAFAGFLPARGRPLQPSQSRTPKPSHRQHVTMLTAMHMGIRRQARRRVKSLKIQTETLPT